MRRMVRRRNKPPPYSHITHQGGKSHLDANHQTGNTIMANWCSNTIQVTGTKEDISKVKDLFINTDNEVDFEIISPMPNILRGLICTNKDGSFKLNDAIDDRIGLLRPSEFVEKLDETFKSQKYQDFNIDAIKKLIGLEPFFDENTPIEKSIEMSVNANIKSNRPLELPPHYFPNHYSDLIEMLLRVLDFDMEANRMYHYKTVDWNAWSMSNWGTKKNAFFTGQEEALGTPSNPDHEIIGYYFDTAWSPPKPWLETLLNSIDTMDVSVDIDFKYAEGGCWFGGTIYRDSDGEVTHDNMSNGDIQEFLNIDDFDEDDEDEE